MHLPNIIQFLIHVGSGIKGGLGAAFAISLPTAIVLGILLLISLYYHRIRTDKKRRPSLD